MKKQFLLSATLMAFSLASIQPVHADMHQGKAKIEKSAKDWKKDGKKADCKKMKKQGKPCKMKNKKQPKLYPVAEPGR